MTPLEILRSKLTAAGYQPYQVNGMLARVVQESSGRTSARNPADPFGGSLGLGQWNGPRLAHLREFAAAQNKPVTDPNVQSDFLIHELNTTEARAGNMLRNSTDITGATKAAMAFERPQGFTWDDPTQGLGWAATLKRAQQLQNAGVPGSGFSAPATQPPGMSINSVPDSVTANNVLPPAAMSSATPSPSAMPSPAAAAGAAGAASIGDKLKTALLGDKGQAALGGIAKSLMGTSQPMNIPPPPNLGMDSTGNAQGAAQLLAALLQKQRQGIVPPGGPGMTLNSMLG